LCDHGRLRESGRAKEAKPMTKLIDISLKLKIWKDTHGQDLVEYALMAGFLACASGYTLPAVATDIANVMSKLVGMMAGGDTVTAPGA
jgi:pilus assembly protein Flp/PilA